MLSVITLLFEFVVLALFKSTGTENIGNFFASVLILIHALLVIASFNQNKRYRKYAKYLTIGFVIRLLLLFVDILAYPSIILPNSHSDEDMFYDNAVYYAQYSYTSRGLYCRVMGILFRFIGYNRLYGQYISMLCAIVALLFFVRTIEELDIDRSTSNRIIRIVCMLPNYAILSSLFMREGIIYMFLTLSLFCFILWTKRKKEIYFVLAMGFVFPAAAFHSGTIAVLVGYITSRIIYDNDKEIVKVKATNVAMTLLFALVAVYVISKSGNQFMGKFDNLESLEDIANTNTRGGSSYAQYVGNSDNPVNMVIYTPLRIFFFLFSPKE